MNNINIEKQESIEKEDEIYYFKENDKCCCICFDNKVILASKKDDKELSLNDIDITKFENNIIPNEILILSCCNEHYICIDCLRKLVNNYESHPINENNSHVYCPYPFEECKNKMELKNIFNHSDIEKIFKTEKEKNDYRLHYNHYIFPGYTIIKCPMEILGNNICNADILIENEILKTKGKGEIVLECNQNNWCLKRFCFTCKKIIPYYQSNCNDCIIAYENESPHMYNYYLNKKMLLTDGNISEGNENTYLESEYLYINREITQEIAIEQIIELIENVNSYMICPICKISLYKTEKCNGLSHHNIERCYACGGIGYKLKGLGDHWMHDGVYGCYRFDTDSYVKENLNNYKCLDNICTDHEIGDCAEPTHKQGIIDMFISRKKAYIYHIFKSLLKDIRYEVYDAIYDKYKNEEKEEIIEILPYKQTFKILEVAKHRIKDYTEDIVYKCLKLKNPKLIESFKDKKFYINYEEYTFLYKLDTEKEKNDMVNVLIAEEARNINNQDNSVIRQIQNIQEQLEELNEIINDLTDTTEQHQQQIHDQENQDEDVDMTDLIRVSDSNHSLDMLHRRVRLPSPPSFLRRQFFEDSEDEDFIENLERYPLLPENSVNVVDTNVGGNTLITSNISQNNDRIDGYITLDEMLDLLNNDYE